MLNPDLNSILQDNLSRYSLVTATAKRAREIAEENEDEKIISTEKPVSVALKEIMDGKFTIVEPIEIRDI